jgi:hypothetical protein
VAGHAGRSPTSGQLPGLSTGVQHVPLPDLGFTEITKLVKLLRYAISQDGRDALLIESNRTCVEGLVRQIPSISETLQSSRLPLGRHVRRASDAYSWPDDIFRFSLAIFVGVGGGPCYAVTRLEGKSIFISTMFISSSSALIRRNPMYRQICGGAPPVHLLSFRYTRQEYTLLRGQSPFPIMLYRRTPQPSRHFSMTCRPLPTRSR